jgi:hypothetical protein
MSSTLSLTRPESSAGRWATEPSVDANVRPANDCLPNKRPSLGKRASHALARFVITVCIGVAATVAWQSYGGTAREVIASSSPQLGWLAPQAAPIAQAAPAAAANERPSPA